MDENEDRLDRLAKAHEIGEEERFITELEPVGKPEEDTGSAGERLYENADKTGRMEVWKWGPETLVIDSEWVDGPGDDAAYRMAVYNEEGLVYGLTRLHSDGESEVSFDAVADDPFGVETVEGFRNAYQELTGRGLEMDLRGLDEYAPGEERHDYLG